MIITTVTIVTTTTTGLHRWHCSGKWYEWNFSFSFFLSSFLFSSSSYLSVRSCQLTVKIIKSGERAQITTATAAERKTENGNGWENTENGKEGETYQKEYSKNKLIKNLMIT